MDPFHQRRRQVHERLLPSFLLIGLRMELMKHPVYHGREDYTSRHDDNKTAVQRIDPREEFSTERLDRRDWSHSTEDHRGIHECINARQIFQIVIACHPREQGQNYQ